MDISAPVHVTIVIPTRNEAGFIGRCLNSIFSADPVIGGMEVLVVDGLSDDGTRQIVEEWVRKQPNLRLLDNPQRIVPTAMNIGIRAARGRWIIRLDAHSEYPPDYFRLCLETCQRTGADNVGGAFITLSRTDSISGKLVRALTTHPFGVGNAGFRIGAQEGPADTVPYGCFRREVFENIGLFDERLVRNQDYEVNRRLLMHGGVIWFNPAIQIRYHNQDSLRGLFRQAFVTGSWNTWTWYVAPYSFAWRHAMPMAFVGSMLTALLTSFFAPSFGILAMGALGVPYLFLAFCASWQQSRRYQKWMFPLLPSLFCAYHSIYGLGTLWGLWVLALGRAPVQLTSERWAGAGSCDPCL